MERKTTDRRKFIETIRVAGVGVGGQKRIEIGGVLVAFSTSVPPSDQFQKRETGH
jgi:hypothetical protein